jgi:hypothetical protein
VRKFTKEDEIEKEKLKEELKKLKISDNPEEDKKLKQMVKENIQFENFEDKYKEFQKAAKDYDRNIRQSKLDISVLSDSRLTKLKLNPLLNNLDRFIKVDFKDEVSKILKSNVDVKNDLDSVLPVLFLSLKVNEITADKANSANYLENYSQNMNLEDFLSLYKKAPDFLRNDDILFRIDKYKNLREENLSDNDINSFNDVYEKDNYFTFIKNKQSLKTVLFLAELFTENSKDYYEVKCF